MTMARDKTGALFAAACELGAMSAGASPQRVWQLRQFGEHLGLVFQLVDDLQGIWGDPATTGKPVMADLRARKKSLPVVAALNVGNGAATRLAELYSVTSRWTMTRSGPAPASLRRQAHTLGRTRKYSVRWTWPWRACRPPTRSPRPRQNWRPWRDNWAWGRAHRPPRSRSHTGCRRSRGLAPPGSALTWTRLAHMPSRGPGI